MQNTKYFIEMRIIELEDKIATATSLNKSLHEIDFLKSTLHLNKLILGLFITKKPKRKYYI